MCFMSLECLPHAIPEDVFLVNPGIDYLGKVNPLRRWTGKYEFAFCNTEIWMEAYEEDSLPVLWQPPCGVNDFDAKCVAQAT